MRKLWNYAEEFISLNLAHLKASSVTYGYTVADECYLRENTVSLTHTHTQSSLLLSPDVNHSQPYKLHGTLLVATSAICQTNT